jgi:hypothetical protein
VSSKEQAENLEARLGAESGKAVGGAGDEEWIGFLHYISMFAEIWKHVNPFLFSTFLAVSASYKRGHPSSGNGLFFAFDRLSAAWDNFSFWGYDES